MTGGDTATWGDGSLDVSSAHPCLHDACMLALLACRDELAQQPWDYEAFREKELPTYLDMTEEFVEEELQGEQAGSAHKQ